MCCVYTIQCPYIENPLEVGTPSCVECRVRVGFNICGMLAVLSSHSVLTYGDLRIWTGLCEDSSLKVVKEMCWAYMSGVRKETVVIVHLYFCVGILRFWWPPGVIMQVVRVSEVYAF